jgi:hypothetical protein
VSHELPVAGTTWVSQLQLQLTTRAQPWQQQQASQQQLEVHLILFCVCIIVSKPAYLCVVVGLYLPLRRDG